MWFLKFTYDTGPEAGSAEHIGPFPTEAAATFHRFAYGPPGAEIVQEELETVRAGAWLDPGKHVDYVTRRL